MKKLFTLLTLALCAIVGKAQEVTLGRTLEYSSTPTEYTIVSDDNAAVTLDDGTGKSGTGKALFYKSSSSTNINAKCFRSLKPDGSTVLDSYDANCFAGVKIVIADGYKLNISKFEASVAVSEQFDYKVALLDENLNALYTSATKSIGSYNKTNATNLDFSDTPSDALEAMGTVYLRLYYWYTAGKGSTSKYIAPLNLSVVGTLEEATAPTISASPKSLTLEAVESGVAVTKNFTVKGYNLVDGTYNLTVPNVEGLSVSPTSFTVTGGTVEQEIAVSYSATENVPDSKASITATVGDLDLSVEVNYSANVVEWTLQPISEATTWDFSKDVSGSKQYTTDEEKNTEYVYANIPELTYTSSFDATALAFKGEYPFRANDKKYAQNGTLHFVTTIPGKIVVKFSDTGSSANATAKKRYLVVNGEQTEYWTSRENNGTENPYNAQLNVTTGSIPVPAGDVYITGSSAIIVSYVSFTPMPAEVSGTITASGYNTYSSNYPVDLSTISGGTAYVASGVEDGKVVLTKCTEKIPAGTGIMIAGEAGATFTIGTYSDEATLSGTNLLVGMPNGGKVAVADEGFNYVFGWTEVSDPGFYKVVSDVPTLDSFKAYLHTTEALGAVSGARLGIAFNSETTGIRTICSTEADSRCYNLQGQTVAQPQRKGLYIVSGKKVIMK